MISIWKPTIEKTMQKLVAPLHKVNPTVLTLIGIVPSILFFIAIMNHSYLWAVLFYIGNVLDMVDGAVARRFHKVSRFGGFLDSTLDRIADFFLISCFGFAHIVQWEFVIILLFISYLVSYTRSRAELASGATKSFAVGLIERPERLVILFIGFILFVIFPEFAVMNLSILGITFFLLTALSAITFLQRMWIAYKKL